MTCEEIRRIFGSCKTADDILRTAKALGLVLDDSDLYAVVNALRENAS